MSTINVEQLTQNVGLVSPLFLNEIAEGSYAIQDRFYDDVYGIIDTKIGKAQFFNATSEGITSPLFHDLDTILEIKEGRIGEIEVELSSGLCMICTKNIAMPKDITLDPDHSMLRPNQNTITYFLYKNYPNIKNYAYLDVLSGKPMLDRNMYGMNEVAVYQGKNSPDVTRIVSRLEKETHPVTVRGVEQIHRLNVPRNMVDFTIKEIIDRNRRNLFVENLRRVQWDGVPRIDTFLKDVGGFARLPDDLEKSYLAIAMRVFVTSVLERNLNEFYYPIQAMLVLIGDQHSGKSTFCNRMGFGERKWYRSTPENFKDRRKLIESANGAIVLELMEAIQFEEASNEWAKFTIDMTDAQYRAAYAEQDKSNHIYHTMIATTNNETLLKDATGNRRYLPVFMDMSKATKSLKEMDDSEIWQVWAEGLHMYDLGERWNTHLYEPDGHTIRKCILQVQMDIAEPEEGGTALRFFLDTTHPSIGEWVIESDIREYLRSETEYSASEQERILSNFRKHAMGYGWQKTKTPHTVIHPNGKRTNTRQAWQRVRAPIFEEQVDESEEWL